MPNLDDEDWGGPPGPAAKAVEDLDWGESPGVSEPRAEPVERDSTAERRPPGVERAITVLLEDGEGRTVRRAVVGARHTLTIGIRAPVPWSLVLLGDQARIPDEDVPADGLVTDWTIVSTSASMASIDGDVSVEHVVGPIGTAWKARFSILVERGVDSESRRVAIVPFGVDADLSCVIHVGTELYRRFRVQPARDDGIAGISKDQCHVPLVQTGLPSPAHGTLSVTVSDRQAVIRGDTVAGLADNIVPWAAARAEVAPAILRVRDALDRFRIATQSHLDDIGSGDLGARLDAWNPGDAWTDGGPNQPDSHHRRAWEGPSTGPELRELAFAGRQLLDAVLPPRSGLRDVVASLPPGHRLNIAWTPASGEGWIPHVPWGLMYFGEIPERGPLDPTLFLGLRLRLGYTAYDVQAGSKALGTVEATSRAHLLYWGDGENDAAGRESEWQRRRWADRPNHVFAPRPGEGDRKVQALGLLRGTGTLPTSVLYLFCRCSEADGLNPTLRFGGTSEARDVLRSSDLGTAPLRDRPLVFANACSTSGTDPHMTNQLEKLFIDRGCRAFIGTEMKVPVTLASRFADVYFHLLRRVDGRPPTSAGEAMAQARWFLWSNYRNLGGLLYALVNQYDLYLASEGELLAWRDGSA